MSELLLNVLNITIKEVIQVFPVRKKLDILQNIWALVLDGTMNTVLVVVICKPAT